MHAFPPTLGTYTASLAGGTELTDVAGIVIPIAVPAIVLAVTAVVYLVLRRKAPEAQNLIVFTVVFGLFNLVTNAWFVLTLWLNASAEALPDFLKYAALASFGVTIIINVTAAAVLMRRLSAKNTAANAWSRRHNATMAFGVAVSAGHLTSLEVLSSKILRLGALSADLDVHDEQVIMAVQAVTFFTEDIPMVGLQAYVVVTSSFGVNTVAQSLAYITLVVSVVSLLFSGAQRLLYWIGHRSRRHLAAKATMSDYLSDLAAQTSQANLVGPAASQSFELGVLPTSFRGRTSEPSPPLQPPPLYSASTEGGLSNDGSGWTGTASSDHAQADGGWASYLHDVTPSAPPAPKRSEKQPPQQQQQQQQQKGRYRRPEPMTAWASALSELQVDSDPTAPTTDDIEDTGVAAEDADAEVDGGDAEETANDGFAYSDAPEDFELPANLLAAQSANRVAAGASALARKIERDKEALDRRLRQLEMEAGTAPVVASAPPKSALGGRVHVSTASVRQVAASAAITRNVAEKAELDRKLLQRRLYALESAQKVAVTVRRYGETRGGFLLEVGGSLPTFLAAVNKSFNIGPTEPPVVALREARELALITDTGSLLANGMVLFAMTAWDERAFA